MISTSQVVESLIKETPFLEAALASDIVNYSSLARYLKPKIEEKLFKDIRTGAVIMALKRISFKLKGTLPNNSDILKTLGDITIRSNLIDYTFLNSPTLGNAQDKLLEKTANRKDIFITISNGISQVTIIASEALDKDIKEIFKDETPVCSIENLSSLTVRIPVEATKTPGVLYSMLKILAWEGINLIEAVSTFTELTVVLDSKDIDRAFSLLKT
ncbi:MAG: Uncharacterized protein G01um10147_176 [Microgenomates group bacterium Gr01-1014_7]|nr:MAG: Uncharacterized protein G01um10147_176 [Microgenomates group bacterium Gr01-1014_7]